MIYIDGTRFNGDAKKLEKLYAYAPKAFLKTIRVWMREERTRYIGNRKKDGKFRKKLSRKSRSGRTGKWPDTVVKSFQGFLIQPNKLDGMTMRAGFGLKSPSKFALGLRMMDQGYSGSRAIRSGKNMTVPVYRNLKKVYSGPLSRAYQAMQSYLDPVKINGRVYWFDRRKAYKKRRGDSKYKRDALMFVGRKQIDIQPQFNFEGYLEGERPRMTRRAIRELKRTIYRLNRGTTYRSDFR